MRRAAFAIASAAAVLAASCACPAPHVVPEPVPSAEDRAKEVKPMGSARPRIVEASLENGLRILMIEDHSAPLVSYQVWFGVGSSREREAAPGEDHGITGLSHFFEHMMFRGTEAHPKFFDEVYARGGKLNAFTWLDETVYWENVPSEHLADIIRMEADRLEHMKIDFLNLEPEREVVKSERLLRTENPPEGKAEEVLQARVFEKFPYHWGTIGWMHDLNRVTVEEAQRYHEVYYAPGNATVIVVGDHDPAKTLELIRAAYGHLPAREVPPEKFTPEPPQTEERREAVYKPVDPQIVLFAFRAPAVRERDFAVLEVLDRLLVGSKSSRLQEKLVFADPPRLGRLWAYLFPIRHPYMYTWGAELLPGTTVRDVERAFDEEVRAIAATGVAPDELSRAVAQLRSDIVRQNLSNQKKAEMIGFSLRATDSPTTFLDRLELYGEITVDDVKRVAGAVLRPENRTWTPVVDPSRAAALLERMTASAGPVPPQVASLAKDAFAWLLESREVRDEAAALDEEQAAIAALEARAAHHAAGADAAGKEAIRKYLDENEKGSKKRRERLEAGRASLEERRMALEKTVADLRKRLTQVRRARFDATRGPGGLVFDVAVAILEPEGTKPPAPLDAGIPVPVALAHGALLAWIHQDRGEEGAAASLRAEVLRLGDADSGIAGDDLARDALALAWDTQVTGRRLASRPPAAPTGRKPRSGGR